MTEFMEIIAMSVSPQQKPRDMFRWAFQEGRNSGKHYEAAAMDAFDYVWRRYGLEALLISPGRDS